MTENAVQPDPDSPAPVLLVGAVTWDVVDGQRVPGGAVTYAARVATALGIRAYALVAAGDDANLDAFAEHELAVVRLEQTMTLEHRFEASVRSQRVVSRPHRGLHPSDLPSNWPPPRTMVLGTLLSDDIDTPAFLELGVEEAALIAQGMQRRRLDDGAVRVVGAPSPALLGAARPNVTIFLARDEVARWSPGALARLASRVERVIVTQGAEGARVINTDGSEMRIEPVAAQPIDSTGAGDVFAAAFILGLRAGLMTAGRLAAAAAACEVETLGPAPLPPLAQIAARAGVAL